MGKRAPRSELESLYRERYERFLRVALGIVRDQAAAHDAVQDGFARALSGLNGYDGRGSFEAWVWRIVVNAALATLSRQAPLLPTLDELSDDDSDELGVRAWVAQLPDRQRLVVFLRYYADLDYRAIALATGVEVGTISATLSAAHSALRRNLREVRQ